MKSLNRADNEIVVFAIVASVAAAFIAMPAPAKAQAYPNKAVRIIVPHPVGGPGDIPPRGFAAGLSQSMGQPFVVENRDGADGIIGVDACVKSPPDGYTLCSTSNGTTIVNSVVRPKLSFDPFKDLVGVVQTGTLYSMIMARPEVPANSMTEVLAMLKAKPESLTLGTYGGINMAAMVGQYTKSRMGAAFYPIPYKSASQELNAALAGDVQVVGFALGAASTHVKAGKMKPLAVNSDKRLPDFPNVPTLKETGIDVNYRSWFAFFAPAGTPREVVRRINVETAKMIADPQFKAKFLTSQGLETDFPTGASPEDFAKFLLQEREDFIRLVKVANIPIQKE
jgi:tripartite-type tricarboxylate transporter receptor subunit TctC